MAGITLETAKAQLELWTEASSALAKSQSYTIGSRSLTRANASEVLKMINYWSQKVSELECSAKGGRRVTRGVIVDL